MFAKRNLAIQAGVLALFIGLTGQVGGAERQFYNDWVYYPPFGYYYSSYYYQPSGGSRGYKFQFCMYYPSQPRFVYYYDPLRHSYWGRLDLKGMPDRRFSVLAAKDRKAKLSEIPEEAFPKPGKMPSIPESTDGAVMEPVKHLPKIAAGERASTPAHAK